MLDKVHWAKLFGRQPKCEFLEGKVDYLGFEVSREGIHNLPEKMKANLNWHWPRSTHDIHSFLGLAL